MDDAKTAIRKHLRGLRDALGDAERRVAAAAICQRVLARTLSLRCHRVALYATFGGEVATEPLHAALRAAHLEVAYPRVRSVEPAQRLLDFVVAETGPAETGPAAMQPGRYGIREPTGDAAPLSSIDLVVVPGIGFDRTGVRLGYGGGYYDRTLAVFGGVCVGIGFACQLVDRLPAGPHDRLMDLVVTENEVIEAAAVRAPGRGLI